MEILHETKYFYKNLYKRSDCTVEENIHEKLKKFRCPKLNSKEAVALEGPLNESEILNFPKITKNSKSPDPDGFTCEF